MRGAEYLRVSRRPGLEPGPVEMSIKHKLVPAHGRDGSGNRDTP